VQNSVYLGDQTSHPAVLPGMDLQRVVLTTTAVCKNSQPLQIRLHLYLCKSNTPKSTPKPPTPVISPNYPFFFASFCNGEGGLQDGDAGFWERHVHERAPRRAAEREACRTATPPCGTFTAADGHVGRPVPSQPTTTRPEQMHPTPQFCNTLASLCLL
jgi:hypothetical protein